MTADREPMTSRKFWCHALVGGIGSHLDWLAISLIGGGHSDFEARKPSHVDDGQPSMQSVGGINLGRATLHKLEDSQ
jgi:hypothetical protein